MYKLFGKRLIDIASSSILLIVLSPLLIIISILVRVFLGKPVIFKQKRPGLNERIFTLYKFRTMTDEKDENGELLPNEERKTPFGRVLRSTSLDELPEIYNVLKGDMSFIGPRPLLVEYLGRYNKRQKRRHEVRPGISGYTAVNGRTSLDWETKLEMDIYYVENISFLMDLKIFVKTFTTILFAKNISSDRGKFQGNKDE